ncbi:hypothetical protein PGB34_04840 [Xenophilus arseniciresistens]|uniref:Uncharacterized protein n=1 Tax=Xenophilus arseniciresistens TaxID=1283306 RepID=A0AAE3SY39_9BURK|nr:hypothetical protein [Xenophilus arseniciresistens]MDA7415682.1 hypothetical protein [Xenophilus arseniciresistens]
MILVKTELGHQLFKDRTVRLTPRQRAAFILFDGKRSVNEVRQSSQAEQSDVDVLLSLGLLSAADAHTPPPLAQPPGAVAAPTVAEPAGAVRSAQQRYQAAYPLATQLTASLGLRGLRLNLAVEAASSCEELLDLLPRIRAAVGAEKAAPLEQALAP